MAHPSSNAEIRRALDTEIADLQERIRSLFLQYPAAPRCCVMGCGEDAAWVRSTQFSGEHEFCDAHARSQNDFGKSDSSYFFWSTIEEAARIHAEVEAMTQHRFK